MTSNLYLPESYDLPRIILWEKELGKHAMAFREIPAECFRMGSRGEHHVEEPRHWVELSSFWMAETPVTQAQWRFLVEQLGDSDRDPSPSDLKDRGDNPVENIGWSDCWQLCNNLASSPFWKTERKACGLPEALKPRLPTEAEWEYACRAGTETDYHSGEGEAALAEVGWYDEDFATGSTHAVRAKGSAGMNGFGLYDMHGNVWEWCLDAWNENAYAMRGAGVENPLEPGPDGSLRVMRGGSWCNRAVFCRSAFRDWRDPGNRFRRRGFRVCLSSGPVENQHAVGDRKTGAEATGAGGAPSDDLAGLNPPREAAKKF